MVIEKNEVKCVNLAAVVVTYNRKELLKKCLGSLLNQTRSLDEIIVLDNASKDGTSTFVGEQFPQVTYIKLSKNIGGAGGFHEGIKIAYEKSYDWIWVMDDDVIPKPDALEKLLNFVVTFKKRSMAISIVENQNNAVSAFRIPRNFYDGLKYGMHVGIPKKNIDSVISVDLVGFGGLLISNSIISKIGLPNEQYFLYFDDTDYCLRALKHNIEVFVVPTSIVEHHINLQVRHFESWRDAYYWRNYIACFRLHQKVFNPQARFGISLRVAASVCFTLLKNLLYQPRNIKVQIKAILDGYLLRLGKLDIHEKLKA